MSFAWQQDEAMTSDLDHGTPRNRLLAGLPPADLDLLTPSLVRVSLERGHVIEMPNEPVSHVYFPEPGVISLVAHSGATRLEAGVVGPEGMTGLPVVFGVDCSSNETFVQIPCRAWRIASVDLRRAMEASETLRDRLLLFGYAFQVQLSQTLLCNGCFPIEQRLARWLLMCHDRSDREDLALTHEFLALMLGVRRAGVTLAAQALVSAGALRSSRGTIGIRDRAMLLAAAGDAYGVPESEYDRIMAPG